MGFVFQFYNLMPVLTAVENVELPLLVAAGRVQGGAAKRARRARISSASRDRADHVPDELSGGQRQRVTIARALVNDPAIVWADEPTGDLDSENADEIVALMRRLNREHGLTFLIVTHDIGVGRKTDRIVRMVDGQIVDETLEVVAMVARATLAEIDTVRMSIDEAVELFRTSVRSCAARAEATRACYVLLSPEGKALVLTFWERRRGRDRRARRSRSFYARAGREVRDALPRAARAARLTRSCSPRSRGVAG